MSTNKKTPFGHKIAKIFDLPLDTMIDWPCITLNGNKNLVIHNHRGVIEYDHSVARINTKLGELMVSGDDLVLVCALQEEIIIEGKIQKVELVDWR